jgi:phosphoribosylaminoimidazole (AIR) synthetase
VFNLGVGMIAVVATADVEAIVAAATRAQVAAWLIGEVRAGETRVRFLER